MSSIPRASITLADAAPRLAAAQAAFQAVAYPGKVDLVTRELVRITSGRLSRCSSCRNLRLRAAIERGFDEEMVAQLDDVAESNLSDAQKIAAGAGPDVVRLSIGIEDKEDIIADLEQGLAD